MSFHDWVAEGNHNNYMEIDHEVFVFCEEFVGRFMLWSFSLKNILWSIWFMFVVEHGQIRRVWTSVFFKTQFHTKRDSIENIQHWNTIHTYTIQGADMYDNIYIYICRHMHTHTYIYILYRYIQYIYIYIRIQVYFSCTTGLCTTWHRGSGVKIGIAWGGLQLRRSCAGDQWWGFSRPGTPKWMVYNGKSENNDDFGVPPFLKPPFSIGIVYKNCKGILW